MWGDAGWAWLLGQCLLWVGSARAGLWPPRLSVYGPQGLSVHGPPVGLWDLQALSKSPVKSRWLQV